MNTTNGGSSSEDVESGVRFRLNTDSYDNGDVMEDIPNLGSMDADSSSTSIPSGNSSSATEHNVIARMSTIEYLWRRHVRTRTNNTTVQAMLDRVLLVFLFLASVFEQPLQYLLGNSTNQTSKNQSQHGKKAVQVTRGVVAPAGIAYQLSQGRNPKKNPVVCFHMDSRSSDEFVDILPLLAHTGRRVVAIDVPGYGGWSENPKKKCTIHDLADACLQVADSLLMENFVCLASAGLGTALATSLASRYPNRVKGCILVNILYNPKTAASPSNSTKKEFDYKEDGSHWLELHAPRKFLEPDLNLRCVQTAITQKIQERARQVDHIVLGDPAAFDLESAARKCQCPTLCVSGEAALATLDARGLGGTQRFDTACRLLPHCEVSTLTGPRSTLYMINQASQEFTSLCAGFLDKHSL